MAKNKRIKLKNKRIMMALLVILALFLCSSAMADMQLPQSLSMIEAEAFQNVPGFTGVLLIPSSVRAIGDDAFSGTDLFALRLPESVVTMGSLDLDGLAYIRIEGNTQVSISSIQSADYLIVVPGSQAEMVAQNSDIYTVPQNRIVEEGGFYYKKVGAKVTLLSAIDPALLNEEIIIPESIGSYTVVSALPTAFRGCTDIKKLRLPETLRGDLPDNCFPTQATVEWYEVTTKQNDFELIAPEQIKVGQDLILRFASVPYAQQYNIWVGSYDNVQLEWNPNVNFGGNIDSSGWGSWTFYGHEHTLVPGDYYVSVSAVNYSQNTSFSARADFTVTDYTRPTAPEVEVNKTTFDDGEEIVFTINTEGVERWTYKTDRYSGGNGNAVTSNTTVWKTSADASSNGKYQFGILKEGVWSEFSLVQLEINRPEMADSFELQIPEQIMVGQDLQIRFESVPYAQQYNIWVGSYDNVQLEWNPNVNFGGNIDSSGWGSWTFYGHEHTLVPGNYYVSVSAVNYSLDTSVTEAADFTVTDYTRPTAPEVEVNKTTFDDGEEIVFTINTEGAERWTYKTDRYSGGNGDAVTSNTTVWKTSADASSNGEYRFGIQKDGIWSEFKIITITINH